MVLPLLFVFVLTACDNGKKESDHSEEKMEQKDKVSQEETSDEHDHGYEMAMATYQCPMKCEGEKTYAEEGTCPECKMDLKKIEVAAKDESEEEEIQE